MIKINKKLATVLIAVSTVIATLVPATQAFAGLVTNSQPATYRGMTGIKYRCVTDGAVLADGTIDGSYAWIYKVTNSSGQSVQYADNADGSGMEIIPDTFNHTMTPGDSFVIDNEDIYSTAGVLTSYTVDGASRDIPGSAPGKQASVYAPLSPDTPTSNLPEVLSVDTPVTNSTIPDSVSVKGWALSVTGNKQVDILVDGKDNGTATIGQPRPDVYAINPLYGCPNSGFSYTLDTSNLDYGNHTITVKVTGNDGITATKNTNVVKTDTTISTSAIGVTYRSHVQNIGWQPYVNDGAIAGTIGQSLRVEALNIKLVNAPAGASIQYQAHVQNIGWQSVVSDGAEAGTDGQGLRVEAVKISLLNMPGYTVQYRAQVQNIGWQAWVSDGTEAGTDGKGLRVETIEVKIVPTTVGTNGTAVATK